MIEEEDFESWDAGLKTKHRLFCLHYCTDEGSLFNATESYRRTYTKTDRQGKLFIPDEVTCATNGSKLLKRADIKLAIRKLLKITQSELDEENTYKVINNLVTMAFFNPAEVINTSGGLKTKKIEDLGEKAKAIAQIRTTQYGQQVQLIDRSKYMDLLMKYLNIVRPEQQIEIKLPVFEVASKSSIEDWNKQSEEEN